MAKARALVVVGVILSAAILYLTSFFRLSAQQNNTESCPLVFGATVRQGPSAGTVLTGTLDLTFDANGALAATLAQENNTEIHVTGQVTGRAINLILNLGPNGSGVGPYVFGVGTALQDIRADDCGSLLGGPFVGPQPGDSGDWVAASPDANSEGIRNVINAFGYEFPGNVAPQNP